MSLESDSRYASLVGMVSKFLLTSDHIRNIVFGFEDGFVSTAGVLFGVATATQEKKFILIAGIITVLVEATSMGAGAYLSEKSSRSFRHRSVNSGKSYIDGLMMFFSYAVAGTICVLPYALWDLPLAQILSVSVTLVGLFFIGYIPQKRLQQGVEAWLIGGLAILIGYSAGEVLKSLTA